MKLAVRNRITPNCRPANTSSTRQRVNRGECIGSIHRLVFLLALFSLICSENAFGKETPTSLAQAATASLRDGNVDDAIEKFDQAILLGGDKSVLRYNKAIAHFRKGEVSVARQLFAGVAISDPKLAAKARYNMGNVDYVEAVELSAEDPQGAIARLKSAIKNYRSSLASDRTDADARANIESAARLIKKLMDQEQQKQQEQQENSDGDQNDQDQAQQDQEQNKDSSSGEQDSKSQDGKSDQSPNDTEQSEQPSEENSDGENQQEQNDDQRKQGPEGEQQEEDNNDQQAGSDGPQQQSQDNQSQSGESEQEQSKDGAEGDSQEQSGSDSQSDQQQDSQSENLNQDQNSQQNAEQPESSEGDSSQNPNGENENQANSPQPNPGESKPPPEGELKALNEQEGEGDGKTASPESFQKGQKMTLQEARKMLQAVRDRDLRRRIEKLRQMQVRRVRVEKDW